jgi:hypothetical protein
MAILDAQGRILGRVSILDLGAVVIIVLVLIGIFFAPGSGGSVAQVGASTQPIEVDLLFRSVIASSPDDLLQTLQTDETTNMVVRNQPSGTVNLLQVKATPRSTAVPQPDGSVIALPDPRPELDYTIDLMVTIGGEAQITDDGPVLGGAKLKIGTTAELAGQTYTMVGKVADVRL